MKAIEWWRHCQTDAEYRFEAQFRRFVYFQRPARCTACDREVSQGWQDDDLILCDECFRSVQS